MNTTALPQIHRHILGSGVLIAPSPTLDAGKTLSRRIKNKLHPTQSSQIIGWTAPTRMRIMGVGV